MPNTKHSDRPKKLVMYFQNVRGIRSAKKSATFKMNLLQYQTIDIIALNETFLNQSVCDGELFPSEYIVIRKDRPNDVGYGGVLLAVRRCCTVQRIMDIDDLTEDKELIFAKVTWKHIQFICCVAYLHPRTSDEKYISVFNCIEHAMTKYSAHKFILMGDFNLNTASANVNLNYYNFIHFCNVKQHNNVVNPYGGMLDLVLSNFNESTITVSNQDEPLVWLDRPHPALNIVVSLPRGCSSCKGPSPDTDDIDINRHAVPGWNFYKADLNALYLGLVEADWSAVLGERHVDEAVEKFYSILNGIISQYVPVKRNKNFDSRYVYPKWYTAEIVHNIQQKYYNLKRYKAGGGQLSHDLFKYYRKKVKILISTAYTNYTKKMEQDIARDPTAFWQYVKDRKNDRGHTTTYKYEGNTVTGQEAVDSFAKHFSSVFLSSVPELNAEKAAKSGSAAKFASHVAIDRLTVSDIRRSVGKLKTRASPGPDLIPPFMVKDCISALEVPLMHLYNAALDDSHYPQAWKVSRVTPIPKETSRDDVTSYRPIAVLSVFGKVFESIIDSLLKRKIDALLTDCQHGFRSSRSTTTNHINFADYILSKLDDKSQVDTVYFDFKKAFDLVDNDILLSKFAEIGFNPKLINFFASYLRNRRQYVQIGGYQSEPYYTLSGVSQGSTLGPTQFLIMINDLPTVVQYSKCLLFADDLKLYIDVKGPEDSVRLQHDIKAVEQWALMNRLQFNQSKCKVISFARKAIYASPYYIGDNPINRVTEIRDLGLALNSRFTFKDHILKICKKAHRTLGFIMRTSYAFADSKVALILYNAYVRSVLEFGAIVWDPRESIYIEMIEKIQRKFARFIYKRLYNVYPYLFPSMFVFGMTGFDSLVLRRKLMLIMHYHAVLNGGVDNLTVVSRMGLFVPDRYLRGGGATLLRRVRPLFATLPSRTCGGANAPTVRAISLLNQLLALQSRADVFGDSSKEFFKYAVLFLNEYLCKAEY